MKSMTRTSNLPTGNMKASREVIPSKRKRGPKRIEYIPPQFREIEGVDLINTARQLVRLAKYLNTAPSKRRPYAKLGATVIVKSSPYWQPPFSIWAVFYEGRVRIVRLDQDPRSAAREMASLRQPWNVERAIAAYVKPKSHECSSTSVHAAQAH